MNTVHQVLHCVHRDTPFVVQLLMAINLALQFFSNPLEPLEIRWHVAILVTFLLGYRVMAHLTLASHVPASLYMSLLFIAIIEFVIRVNSWMHGGGGGGDDKTGQLELVCLASGMRVAAQFICPLTVSSHLRDKLFCVQKHRLIVREGAPGKDMEAFVTRK
jgi:hypothetical protein